MANVPQGSVSKLLTSYIASLYANKLQWHRHVVGLFAAFNITCLVGKLYWHYATGRYDCTPLDFWSLVMSWAARLAWTFLFREPDRFLGARRPSARYKLLVVGTVEMTTLPNLVLHVWALSRARAAVRGVYAGVANAAAALFFWITLLVLVHRMAWVFLLKDDGADFEPSLARTVGGSLSAIAAVPYSDEPLYGHRTSNTPSGYLSAAYAKQRDDLETRATMTIREMPSENARVPVSTGDNMQTDEGSQNEQNDPYSGQFVRCKTIARFEYMTQAHTGAHSWWLYPIFPVAFSSYATIILIMLLTLIQDDRKLPRDPSPTIKKSLYMPLGIYLMSFYALKHRTRASLFESFDVAVPEPWKKLFSILPTSPVFRHNLTGEVTTIDPRQRAMPPGKARDTSRIDNNAYIKAYNSTRQTCTSYWGHIGREHNTKLRIRPAVNRIGFLSLTICLIFIGFWNTFFTYDVQNIARLIPFLPPQNLARATRVVRMWQALAFMEFALFVPAFFYAVFCLASVLVLWGHVILQYAERENRERAASGEDEGRIRLE